MIGRNSENIYGYSGKRSPSFNFVSGSINSAMKKNSTETKPKNVVLKEIPKENVMKSIIFCNGLSGKEDVQMCWSEGREAVHFGREYSEISNLFNKPLLVEWDGCVSTLILQPHEKGISVRTDNFGCGAEIEIKDNMQIITLKPLVQGLKVVETKIQFKNPAFPFYFVYENNEKYDGIFNDFVSSNLPEIRPPTMYTVPVKVTNSQISFRQFISYIKTKSFLNFKVNQSGWYFDSFGDDPEALEEEDLPSGVAIKLCPSWVYHPRGTRIEHWLQFQ